MTETLPPPVGAPAPPPSRHGARPLVVIGAILATVLVAWGAVTLVDLTLSRTTTAHASYDAVGTVELVADGKVTVAAAPGGVEVERIAHSGISHPHYAADQSADRLVVTHRCPSWTLWQTQCAGELDVTLPASTHVVVRTSNGQVVASGLAGDVQLHTSNGRVDATRVSGRLSVDTSNGEIAVRQAGDDVDLRTSNGAIRVTGVGGSLTADTSNGRIDVRDVSGSARATTSNGGIEVAGVDGDVVARTSNGEVTVHGGEEPVRLTIDTTNGSKTVEGATDPDATRTVEIRSSNGDVAYLAG
ncbi:DUF4097 family beta strand repeat-containing protein [Xylanimonas sp. McL0601]|uniref:DUF4097 family beta strand repeat-containing protein n=1 Tax=Xylanimonas sp. McL0601 TaxID=3414739 RepID=UPI003CF93F9E